MIMYTVIVYREGMIYSVSQRFLTMEPSWNILTGLVFRGERKNHFREYWLALKMERIKYL